MSYYQGNRNQWNPNSVSDQIRELQMSISDLRIDNRLDTCMAEIRKVVTTNQFQKACLKGDMEMFQMELDSLKNQIQQQFENLCGDIRDNRCGELNNFVSTSDSVVKEEVKKLIEPIDDKITNIRTDIKLLKKSLFEKDRPDKTRYECRVSKKLKINVISRKHLEHIGGIDTDIKPDNMRLQRKNGTYHDIAGRCEIDIQTPYGMEKVTFFVVDSLKGDSYLSKETYRKFFSQDWVRVVELRPYG